jgi:Domain of unknown function (DUF4342)
MRRRSMVPEESLTFHMSTKEEFKVSGEELITKVKGLIAEGSVRRIIIKDKDGKTIIEVPLTIGIVGALIAPTLAAIGAVAALVTECSIIVERD